MRLSCLIRCLLLESLRTVRRIALPIGLSAVVLAGCSGRNEYIESPPPDVTVTRPLERDVTEYLEATGTAHPVMRVEIRARVRGFLKECHVNEGDDVEAGQLLLVIDEGPFRVKFEQAKARLVEAEAALKKAEQSQAREISRAQVILEEPQLRVAVIEEQRILPLASSRAVTREDVERAMANRRKSEAQVVAAKANLAQALADYETNISAARANVDVRNAEIDLGYCRIASPAKGRIGRIHHDVVNLVGDGQATLTTVVQYHPIHIYTTRSVDDFLKFRRIAAGSVPLVNATGAGAASRQSLGTAVFGGMIAATVLAVFFVPVFYVVLQWLSELRRKPAFHGGISPGSESHEACLPFPL